MSVTICLALEERFCIRFAWQGFFGGKRGGYSHSFYEKLLKSFPVSDRANARQLLDGLTAGKGYLRWGQGKEETV